jgi:putative SOS response-associated peptidase YedK
VPAAAFCKFGDKLPGIKAASQHWFGVIDQPVFFFAGFWRPIEDGKDEADVRRFTFVTSGYLGEPGNHIVGAVHPKAIPVILHREDLERWLTAPFDEVLTMLSPYPSQLLRMEQQLPPA